jgi:adenylate cyclase
MTAATACRMCGTEPLGNARFCHGCGAALTESSTHGEYKQVTVLFADVVHSMDIAAAVGAERLREIMAELVGCGAAVVQRYGGTMEQFTGDGLMAVFGAPVALEDHAIRACLAALDIQAEAGRLAADVHPDIRDPLRQRRRRHGQDGSSRRSGHFGDRHVARAISARPGDWREGPSVASR